jgi:hypothetical protein
VQKWTEQQRALIKKERKKLMNDVLTSQRKQRQDSLEDRAAQASLNSQKQLRAEIESLRNTLKKQQVEIDTAKSRSRINEKRLRDMISERDRSIQSIKSELEKLNIQHNEVKKERDSLKLYTEELESKKKKKKKKRDISIQPLEQMEEPLNQPSPKVAESASACKMKGKIDGHKDNNDNEAIRILTTNNDLVEQPTEDWLQKHLGCQQHHKTYDPEKYASKSSTQNTFSKQSNTVSQTRIATDSSTTTYPNGTQKEILPDGTMVVRFTNGDIKTTYSHIGIVVYFYAETGVSLINSLL